MNRLILVSLASVITLSLAWAVDYSEQLVQAVVDGDLKEVKRLIERGADVNAPDSEGVTPFQRAAQGGDGDMIMALYRNGADIRAVDKDKNNMVHYAAEGGNMEFLNMLLDRGFSATDRNALGETPLFGAARGGRREAARLFLDRGADPRDMSYERTTLFHEAAYGGDPEIIKWVAEGDGIDIHAVNKDGQRALDIAAYRGHEGAVVALLDLGADPTKSDRNKQGPLHWAMRVPSDGMSKEREDTVMHLIDKGANVNAPDKKGRTPFHILAEVGGPVKLVPILKSRGARLELSDDEGYTPLGLAILKGDVDMAKSFVSAGAKMDVSHGKAPSPILSAVENGERELVEMFIFEGADLGSVTGSQTASYSDDMAMSIFLSKVMFNSQERRPTLEGISQGFIDRVTKIFQDILGGKLTRENFKGMEWSSELEDRIHQVLAFPDFKDRCEQMLFAAPGAHVCQFDGNLDRGYLPPAIICAGYEYREVPDGLPVKSIRDYLKKIDKILAVKKVIKDLVLGLERAVKRACGDRYRICHERHVNGIMVFQCDDKIYRFQERVRDGVREEKFNDADTLKKNPPPSSSGGTFQ